MLGLVPFMYRAGGTVSLGTFFVGTNVLRMCPYVMGRLLPFEGEWEIESRVITVCYSCTVKTNLRIAFLVRPVVCTFLRAPPRSVPLLISCPNESPHGSVAVGGTT